MKIACQACQAKYTIADEKVLGKIVKIRCKKCGATIVINGNESEGATQAVAQSGGQAYDYAQQPAGEPWTVNVADGDQRTMTTEEIVAAFHSGVVNEETFCWKDGMSDWLPLRDIPELAVHIGGGAQPAPPPPAADDEATTVAAAGGGAGFGSLFGGGSNGTGGALFGGGSEPAAPAAAASAPAAARRAGGRAAGGADLFGSVATAGGEDDVMTSASASPAMAPPKMTGERNENSVLFSLAALTQNAPPEDKNKTTATTEGSGLIDIRALAQSMGKDDNKGGPKHVDDIMNLGGGGAFAPALAAPVLAPPPADIADLQPGEKKKSNVGLMIALGLGALLIIGSAVGLALYFALKPAKDTTGPVASNTTPTAETTSTAPANTGAIAMNDTAASGTSTATPPGTGTATATAKGPPTSSGAVKPPTTGGNTAVPPPPPATTPQSSGGGCCPGESEMQCNMRKSAGQPCPAATAANTGGGTTAPFDRGAASGALGGINLSSCKKPDGPTGSGHVKVTFANNGTVSAVEVDQPPFAGTAVGGCIAQKFRGAKIPAFSGPPVTVGKSFSLN